MSQSGVEFIKRNAYLEKWNSGALDWDYMYYQIRYLKYLNTALPNIKLLDFYPLDSL